MIAILSFLSLVAAGAFVAAVVLLVVRSVKRQPRKPFVILAVVSAVAFLGLCVWVSDIYVPTEKPQEAVAEAELPFVPESEKSTETEPPSVPEQEAPTESPDSSVEDVDSFVDKSTNVPVEEPANSVPEHSDAPAESSPAETEPPSDGIPALSDLVFNGEPVTDVAVRDLVSGYDYILDVAYVIKEESLEVQVAVVVPGGTNEDVVQKAGDKAARYLASLASYSCSDYSTPGADNLGGLFERYNLLIYVDDGLGGIDAYGAKVTSSPVISW